ncbi:hypothetical protein H920_16532 [Fukomys damarensis]|uniref:Uncharacterized protein n=1 Tax=Fukomys damarensis TaxID=885580 RepID=A0A091CWA7_FUKDA|nr:hypothetical protein H920_16532 [Fukomys damarensis]
MDRATRLGDSRVVRGGGLHGRTDGCFAVVRPRALTAAPHTQQRGLGEVTDSPRPRGPWSTERCSFRRPPGAELPTTASPLRSPGFPLRLGAPAAPGLLRPERDRLARQEGARDPDDRLDGHPVTRRVAREAKGDQEGVSTQRTSHPGRGADGELGGGRRV